MSSTSKLGKLVAACSILTVLAGANAPTKPANVTAKRLVGANGEPGNWMSYGRTYSGDHFSPLTQINRQNVGKLGLAWSYDLEEYRPVEATPLVIDGVMYVSSAWSNVYALDARTGKEIWKFDPEVPKEWLPNDCCWAVNRGVAAWNGKIYIATLDARVVAIDAKTGKKVWETSTLADKDRVWPISSTGAPRVIKGKVIIGNSGSDLGARGFISAYDAETGKQVWKFYLVPGNPADGFENKAMEMAAKTWFGEWWRFGGGGAAWETMVYDPDLNLLYVGTGNGSPWNRKIRSEGKGDNLFLSCILALNPDTGAYVWHYQETPGEEWDYNSDQAIVLADLRIKGKLRKVALHAPKNGFFYVIDRATGELLSAEAHTTVNWAKGIDMKTGRPIEVPEARYPDGKPILLQPGSSGGHGWYPMSFDARTGLVYFVSGNGTQIYGEEHGYTFIRGYFNGGNCPFCTPVEQPASLPIAPLRTLLLAWDPVQQKAVWQTPVTGQRGGVLATAGNLAFHGNGAAEFVAYDSANGKRLWMFETQNKVIAAPVSYTVEGEQYIALAVGEGYAHLIPGPVPYPQEVPNTNRVLAFKLGGLGKLPPISYTPPPLPLPPALPANATAEIIRLGFERYHRFCLLCHGFGAAGDKISPDLRYSEVLAKKDEWRAIVTEGARRANGMRSFGDVLTPDLAEAIRLYVISRANSPEAKEGQLHTMQ
jgi:PQQ-dependent dehydrogenase (methanol/ethanol family)